MSTSTEKNGFATRTPKMRTISRQKASRAYANNRPEAQEQGSRRRAFQDQPTRFRKPVSLNDSRFYSTNMAPYTVPQDGQRNFDVLGRLFGKIFGVFAKPATVAYYDQYDPMRTILKHQQTWRADNDDYRPSGFISGHF